jgi:anti-sigma-K factor RskA
MIDERSEAEASLYVLGALPAEELREFERALRADLELQLLVNELRAAADALVVALPRRDPPPSLKQHLLESIDRQEGFAGDAAGGIQLEPAAWQSWMPWALAASFALLCLLLIALGNSLRRQATEARQQLNDQLAGQQREQNILRTQGEQKAAAYQQQLTELQKQIVRKAEDFERQRQAVEKESENKVLIVQREKKGLEVDLARKTTHNERLQQQLADAWASVHGDRFATIRIAVLDATSDSPTRAAAAGAFDLATGRGQLVVENLAPLPPDRDYQLWLFDPNLPGAPVSGGVFGVDEHGGARLQFQPAVTVQGVDKFAVSIERKGGVLAPQGKMVLASH